LCQFFILAPPVIKDIYSIIAGQLRTNVSITIPFYSNPQYTDVNWLNLQHGVLVNNSGDRFFKFVTDARVTLPFNEKHIEFKGNNATLIIQNIEENEFTNYTLRVKNSIGERRYTVRVQSAGMHFFSLKYEFNHLCIVMSHFIYLT